jgi:hypothetical protein
LLNFVDTPAAGGGVTISTIYEESQINFLTISHENRYFYEITRLRASPGHGGSESFLGIFLLLIRRGVVPSGAAAFIISWIEVYIPHRI